MSWLDIVFFGLCGAWVLGTIFERRLTAWLAHKKSVENVTLQALRLLRDAQRMMPGRASKVTMPDGTEIALLHYEDFEMIANKAGYRLADAKVGEAAVWTPKA